MKTEPAQKYYERVYGTSGNGRHEPEPKAEPAIAPVFVRLADVEPCAVAWLWHYWIPLGAVTLFDGDPGRGKSTIALDLAARVTRGWAMPPAGGACEGAEPAGVMILSAEDDLRNTIRPRFDAAGGDVTRVTILTAVRQGDEERPPVLPWDLQLVRQRIVDDGIVMVVVDPLMAFLDGEINAHKDQDVRRCMHRLMLLATETGVAVVLIRHLNKLGHNIALYRGGASIGIVGAARSALIVGTDPNNPNVRVLASNKSNLGPRPQSLTYELVTRGDVSYIGWGEETDLTANDILSHAEAGGKRSVADQCALAMKDILAGVTRVASADLEGQLQAMGFSAATVKRARQQLKVRAAKSSHDGSWYVEMPEKVEGAQGAQQ